MSRVCLFAQFNPRHRIRAHVLHYVREIQSCGFQTIVACSGDRLPPQQDREALAETGATLVFRPNHGLDFGAWRHLILEGHADGADAVLLANDSVFGPFRPLAPIVQRMDAKGFDVWGMIESLQHTWHLQSWFLHFTGAAFRHPEVARVFEEPFECMDKGEIIERGELGLGRALQRAGLRCGAVVRHRDASWMARRRPANMMHIDWHHNLVSGRLPFLKSDLLRTNAMNLPWAPEWERVLRERFKVDTGPITEYLYEYTAKRPARPGAPFPVPVRKIPVGLLGAYVLFTRDRRMAWRSFVKGLKAEMFTSDA
ncbi:MAG TPA: rhamnan synthesis F family protein [Acetobacteraceae bacterium]|nr:rhamnan synthesis F family protein [Acetobacteraceae bacterium]